MREIPERIRGGVEALDKLYPQWENVINLETFRLVDPNRCLDAQLFPSYIDMLRKINRLLHSLPHVLSIQEEQDLGFAASDSETWGDLEKLWTTLILERRENI